MKLRNRSFAGTAVLMAFTILSLAIGSAAVVSKPILYPYGLAVAANGNLYVANTNGNNILVYSPAYVQLTSKTITKGISGPTAVAFDPDGNLWVANSNSNSITEYSSTCVQNTAHTITVGISNPKALAFDGIGGLWVQNGFSTLTVYPELPTSLAIGPLVTLTPASGIVTGIAAYRDFLVTGNNIDANVSGIAYTLNSAALSSGTLGKTCFAAAVDPAGNLYCGNNDNTLTVFSLKTGASSTLAQLSSFPTGIAVDAKRGRIYVALGTQNEIAVYSTSGTLLYTIVTAV